MEIATGATVLVVNGAILALLYLYFSKMVNSILKRVMALEEAGYATSYIVPLQTTTAIPVPAEYDTAASWAEEMASMGFPQPNDEVERQRRMREEAGL